MAEHSVIILLLAVCFFLGSSDGRTLENKVSNVRKLADAINATNPKDVQGLAALVLQFQALALIDGSDDPCLPTKWTWIDCSNDASPRVTALYLSNQNLFGFLPDFSTMVALETIDMDNNLLTGSIPSFLGTLPNLKELNLANNLFSGQVPASILQNKKLNTEHQRGTVPVLEILLKPLMSIQQEERREANYQQLLGAQVQYLLFFGLSLELSQCSATKQRQQRQLHRLQHQVKMLEPTSTQR
nr:probable LRR receptor-like serine/threonine-protein kinase At1g67720 isoform X2 [Coffea arabica]